MEVKEIMERREALEKGSIERLLLSFYTLLEPNRADYFATELITDGEESAEENYIVDHKKLVLRDFKTKTLYEKIENIRGTIMTSNCNNCGQSGTRILANDKNLEQ